MEVRLAFHYKFSILIQHLIKAVTLDFMHVCIVFLSIDKSSLLHLTLGKGRCFLPIVAARVEIRS